MRALVVYESSFGNTGRIARAIWDGHVQSPAGRPLLEVGAAPTRLPLDLELLVVGGPTQVFGMSRPVTRADAQTQAGTTALGPTTGVREWLAALEAPGGPCVPRRSTRASTAPTCPVPPPVGAWRALRRAGFDVAAEAESFWVLGTKGPLRDGELERAYSWGVGLTSLLLGGHRHEPGPHPASSR